MNVSSAALRRSALLIAAGAAASLAIAAPHVSALAPPVSEAPLRAHLSFLADDLLEGRGTGQRGGDLAARYLETQAAALGLQPLGGSFHQAVTIIGSKALPDSQVTLAAGGKAIPAPAGSSLIYGASNGQEHVRFDAPVVFVGYGIHADEERWDDYKDFDVKGKLLIMMVNDPQPTAEEPGRFGGKSLTWYGRWVYKYEEALRHGAAGVLLIHTTASASYPWSVPATSFAHERFNLAGAGNAFEGWIAEDTARALFSAGGQDLDALRARAESRDFRPVALDAQIHVDLHSAIRQIEQYNVVGMVPGTDAKLKDQAVIYSAHWDHLGMGEIKAGEPGEEKRDRIWNGAVDNASGAAALLAMAQAAVSHPAKRTQIFFWPCGEEQGLLGSLAYVRQPLWPLAKTTADLNLDSMNFVGKTRDMGVAGSERSSLYATAGQVAATMGLRLAPAVSDLGGAYFRADHFNFARAGVPAFNVGSAVFSGDGAFDFVNDPQGSTAKMKAFTRHYHQVSDEYHADWDLSGMVQQAQFTLNLGYAVANTAAMPSWNKGEAFGNVKR